MSDNNAKRLIAQTVDDDGCSLLAGGSKFCGLSKDVGRGELNTGEGGASRKVVCFDRMRDSLILKYSLETAEPKAEIGGLLPSNFGRKSLKSVMAGKSVKSSGKSVKNSRQSVKNSGNSCKNSSRVLAGKNTVKTKD